MAVAGVPAQRGGGGGPGVPAAGAGPPSEGPARPGLVLSVLILVAVVANLNLTVATVALPAIGKAFDAAQTAIDLIAVGYSLGLAASVLYLGALGDRYGRKLMLILGSLLAVPAALLAACSPGVTVLAAARLLGGLAAGLAYPTTLALITALWRGQGRTHAIALWSPAGGACSALGPLLAGAMLVSFWWGSVFLITLPLAVLAVAGVILFVPNHVNASKITAAAKTAFLAGDQWAYLAGMAAVLLGGVVVWFFFPRLAGEKELLASYQAHDSGYSRIATARGGDPGPGQAAGPPAAQQGSGRVLP